MLAHPPIKPAHALPRVQVRSRAPGQAQSRASSCKTASRKKSSFSRLFTHARCPLAQTTSREFALFPVASVSGSTIFAYVEGNPISFTDPEGLRNIRDVVRGVTGLSGRPDSVEQMSRRQEKDDEKKKNGYDTLTGYPIPVIPQNRPACVVVCPDAGNSCRPTPTSALPAAGQPGCYQVCYPQGVR